MRFFKSKADHVEELVGALFLDFPNIREKLSSV